MNKTLKIVFITLVCLLAFAIIFIGVDFIINGGKEDKNIETNQSNFTNETEIEEE